MATQINTSADRSINAALTAVLLAIIAAAAALTGDVLDLSWTWPLLAGAIGGLALAGRTWYDTGNKFTAALVAVYGLAAGGWVSWVYAHSAFDLPGAKTIWGAWFFGSIALALIGQIDTVIERKIDERDTAAEAARSTELVLAAPSKSPLAIEWEQRVWRVCDRKEIDIFQVQPWPAADYGDYLYFRLPPGAHRLDQIRGKVEELANDARLPNGCGVEVLPGAQRGEGILSVSKKDSLATPRLYPLPTGRPRTAADPVRIGFLRDSQDLRVPLRHSGTLVIGPPDGGKSNLQHNIIGGLLESDDALVCVLDPGKKGNLARNWIKGFAEGRHRNPAIWWIADDWTEAVHLTRWAVAEMERRQVAYQAQMEANNTDILTLGPKTPMIYLVGDEGARMFGLDATRGNPEAQEVGLNLIQLDEMGRQMALRTALSFVRVTGDLCPAQIKKSSGQRFAFPGSDDDEVPQVMGWKNAMPIEDAPYKGSGFVKVGKDAARVYRSYLLTPQIMDQVAGITDVHRAELPEEALAGISPQLRRVVEGRWQRTLSRMFPDLDSPVLRGGHDHDRQEGVSAPVSAPTGQGTGHESGHPGVHLPPAVRSPGGHVSGAVSGPGGQMSGASGDLSTALSATEEALAKARRSTHDYVLDSATTPERVDSEFEAIADGLWAEVGFWNVEEGAPTDEPEETAEPEDYDRTLAIRKVILSVLEAAGPAGTSPGAIKQALGSAGFTIGSSRVYHHLGQVAEKVRNGVWVHPRHSDS